MSRRLTRILPLVVLVLAVAGAGRDPTWTEGDQQEFLRRHWLFPLAPQGQPPRSFGPLEASLHPDRCGVCHPVQYADWKDSIHAVSMGPGVAGQLVDLHRTDPDQARQCYTCHAPLAEQRPGTVGYDAGLEARGIVCAGCHVRGWQRFGPPRRDGSLVSETPRSRLPHNGVTRTPAFLRAEFCKECHQFPPTGLALNGKLLQNTYEEWKAGPAGAANVQCQDCHMPDRRHLWRGIHDPEMVRQALTFTLKQEAGAVTLTITNARGGHLLPTYVTARLVVSGEQLDASGRVLEGSRRESAIGRSVTLDLSRELSDSRLAPGQSAVFRYALPGLHGRLRLRVVAEPDHFYTRFFATLLEGGGGGAAQIRAALDATRRSGFIVWERDVFFD